MLKPIGQILGDAQAEAEARTYIFDIVQESWDETSGQMPIVDESVHIHGYGCAEGEPDPMVNAIQNAIIVATDVQTKDPIQVTLEPVETGEPPQTFWAGPENVGLALLDPIYVQGYIDPNTGQMMPPAPIDPQVAEQLRARAVPKELSPSLPPALQDGLPAIRPDWLVDLDDRLVADVYQGVFDVHWIRCDADYFIADNLLDNNVQGWAYGLYQFDDDRQRHILTHLPVKQVHIDPTARDITDAAYAGFDIPLDADEAKRQHPHLGEIIDQVKQRGTPHRIDGPIGSWGAAYDRNFRRDMVVFRVMFLRNQPMPLTKDEAVGMGILDEREVPDVPVDEEYESGAEPYAPGPPHDLARALTPDGGDDETGSVGGDDSGGSAVGDSDAGQRGVPAVAESDPDAGSEGIEPRDSLGDPGDSATLDDVDDVIGQEEAAKNGETPSADRTPSQENLLPLVPVVLPTRPACFLAGTDTEVMPDSPAWPTRLTLRQITQVAGQIVDDRECEFFDIPILHNQNIPMSGARPWAMGEPYRLKHLQAALNRTLQAMVDNADWFAHPMTVMSEFTASKLPEEYEDARAKPGISLIIPDDVYRQTGGKVDTIVTPPPLSPAHQALAPMLQDLIDRESGNSEVLQGQANPQIKSGVAINLLQSAATSMIGFKSKRTGRMVRHGATLMLNSLVTRLTTQDLYQIVSKYPVHVLDAVRQRAQVIEWNVTVQVESATGGMQMQKRQLAGQDLAVQAISMQTYREKCGLDDRVEKQRIEQQQQDQARMASMFAPPPTQAPPGKGEQQKPLAA